MQGNPSTAKKSTNGRAHIVRLAGAALSRAAPWLAARVAEKLFATPHRSKRPPRELEWERGARRTTVRSPRGDVVVWEWGSGDRTVLLVHGWAGRGLQLGMMVASLLQQGFRVVAFDAPAHGESPGRTSSLLHFIDAMAAVAQARGPLSALVAHSLGATAAFLAVARKRLEVGRLVALAPAADMGLVTERFSEMTGFTPAVVERMRGRFQQRLAFSWDDIEPLRVGSRMEVPLLVIHDRDDREVPYTEGASLAESCPRGDLVLTSGLGHRRLLRDKGVLGLALRYVNGDESSPGSPQSVPPRASVCGVSHEGRRP